ncbi:MAG: zf-HC2 domain-containing protein [Candidatus Auribacterota bacterium]
MKCKNIQDLFSDYYDGAMNVDEKKSFEDHLDSCEKCCTEYEQFAAVLAAVKSIPPAVPAPELFDRIEQEVRSLNSYSSVMRGITFGLAGCALAACLVAAVYIMMSRETAQVASGKRIEGEDGQQIAEQITEQGVKHPSPQQPAPPVAVVNALPPVQEKEVAMPVQKQSEPVTPAALWQGNVELAVVIMTRNEKADVASLNGKVVSFNKIIDENGGVQYQFNTAGAPTEQVRHELEYLSDVITKLHTMVMRVQGTVAEVSVAKPFYVIAGIPVDKLDLFLHDLDELGTHQKQIDPRKVLDSSASFDENNDQLVHIKIMLRQ